MRPILEGIRYTKEVLLASLPIFLIFIGMVMVAFLIVWIIRKIAISNHFHDNLDEKANTEISILETTIEYKNEEIKRLKEELSISKGLEKQFINILGGKV